MLLLLLKSCTENIPKEILSSSYRVQDLSFKDTMIVLEDKKLGILILYPLLLNVSITPQYGERNTSINFHFKCLFIIIFGFPNVYIFLFGKVSSVEIERICNEVDDSVLETAAIGVPPLGGGPEQLVIAVVFKDSNNPKEDLNQLKISFNSAVQKKLNPLFRVLICAFCSELHFTLEY